MHRVKKLLKLLIVPCLLLLHLIISPVPEGLVVAALLFCLAGDYLLIKSNERKMFVAGLFSFLLGHVFYTAAMLRLYGSHSFIFSRVLPAAVPYAIYGVLFYLYLSEFLGPMRLPAVAYIFAIELMSLTALVFLLERGSVGRWAVFAGSLFFMASDTTLAHKCFKPSSKASGTAVMVTYVLAQFLIVCGLSLRG